MRVVAATNRTLEEEVEEGTVPRGPVLPPERDADRRCRRCASGADDIPSLIELLHRQLQPEFRKQIRGVAPAAMAALKAYPWPGNVRELRNAVERAMLLAEGDELDVDHFPIVGASARPISSESVELPAGGIDLEQLERSLVVQALERSGWNQTRAATLLGLNRDQIRYRIEKFKLEKPV